jgi:hypothetical protein
MSRREDLISGLLFIALLVLAADWLARCCAEWVGVTLP